jgi:hypothetical protein
MTNAIRIAFDPIPKLKVQFALPLTFRQKVPCAEGRGMGPKRPRPYESTTAVISADQNPAI